MRYRSLVFDYADYSNGARFVYETAVFFLFGWITIWLCFLQFLVSLSFTKLVKMEILTGKLSWKKNNYEEKKISFICFHWISKHHHLIHCVHSTPNPLIFDTIIYQLNLIINTKNRKTFVPKCYKNQPKLCMPVSHAIAIRMRVTSFFLNKSPLSICVRGQRIA